MSNTFIYNHEDSHNVPNNVLHTYKRRCIPDLHIEYNYVYMYLPVDTTMNTESKSRQLVVLVNVPTVIRTLMWKYCMYRNL